jgi:hypothetical protein
MARSPHILKGNKTVEMPWEAVWLDTETKPEQVSNTEIKHLLHFGWAAYRRRLTGGEWSSPQWCRFETRDEFWGWLYSLFHGKQRIYLFAHNGAFDLPVLDAFNQLQSDGWTLLSAVIESPPIILRWRKGKTTLQFIDTLNIWRMPLANLGNSIGLRKLRMPTESASMARWNAYGRRDVKVIMRACMLWWDFLKTHNLGGFASTLAGQAMRAYRHAYMDTPILIDDDKEALELARSTYHGGRVECFRLGRHDGKFWLVDVNSMYPSIMRQEPMPSRLIGHTARATVRDLELWIHDRCVTAEVVLETDEPAFPVVHDGRLVFPTGSFTAYLCTPELKYALNQGFVREVKQAAVYEAAPLFERFVSDTYRLRQEATARGDKVAAWQIKILINSLYGKFGQNGRTYRDGGHTDSHDACQWVELDVETGKVWRWRQLGGLQQVYTDEGESRESHPAIASHVASAARLYLWRLILMAERDNVMYSDTDSLVVNEAGMHRLVGWIDADKLGHLKIERELSYIDIRGAKDYDFDGVSKTKGVRKSAKWLADDHVSQEQWSSLKGLLRLGDLTAPRTRTIEKHLSRIYTKGTVLADGCVDPLRLWLT